MLMITSPRAALVRGFGLAAAATLMLSAGTARRAEALTLINPGSAPATEAVSDAMITQVRDGGQFGGRANVGGSHSGGGAHFGGGAHVGGGGFGGRAVHVGGGGFRGGHIGGFRSGGFAVAPVYRSHIGGYRYGGFRRGGYRYAGRPYFYRHHRFHRRFYGGYYPYYLYPRYHRCRIIWTYFGPRRVCHWHRWHRWHHRYRYW